MVHLHLQLHTQISIILVHHDRENDRDHVCVHDLCDHVYGLCGHAYEYVCGQHDHDCDHGCELYCVYGHVDDDRVLHDHDRGRDHGHDRGYGRGRDRGHDRRRDHGHDDRGRDHDRVYGHDRGFHDYDHDCGQGYVYDLGHRVYDHEQITYLFP